MSLNSLTHNLPKDCREVQHLPRKEKSCHAPGKHCKLTHIELKNEKSKLNVWL